MNKTSKLGIIGTAVFIVVLIISSVFIGCERIDAGHVGIKVKLFGSEKGVQEIEEVTGYVWYAKLKYDIYEFPTFVQHVEYSGDNKFIINSRDGSEFTVSPVLNYSVSSTMVSDIFKKYRKPLEDIQDQFLKTTVYDAFRIVANSFTADSLVSNREVFEKRVRLTLENSLEKDGFIINQFTSNLEYPKSFLAAIEAKNNAVQQSLQAENQVRTAEAQAKIKIANANGEAESRLILAKAVSEANKLEQISLTSMIIQRQMIDKWDGKLPVYGETPSLFKSIQ